MTAEEFFGDWSKVVDTHKAEVLVDTIAGFHVRVCPRMKYMFRAFQVCPYKDLKIIILGQDPYPQLKKNGDPVATGVAFANSPDTPVKALSPSLKILRESIIGFPDIRNKTNFDPSLEKIAKQGVLWLNTALTCEANKIGSHSYLWVSFIRSFISRVSFAKPHLVYVLMGSQAQMFERHIDSTTGNYIIRCRHPAYYARNHTKMPSDWWHDVSRVLQYYEQLNTTNKAKKNQ